MLMDPEKEVPLIRSKDELLEYIQPLYIINKYWESKKEYKLFKVRMQNIMRAIIGKQELREYPVNFKFYEDDEEVHTMEIRMFLINVYIWYPFVELYGYHFANEKHIIHAEQLPKVNDWLFDNVAVELYDANVKGSKVNRYMAAVTSSLCSISIDFSTIMGLHYDETTFQDMYMDPEYREMMELEFTGSEQPIEIEEKLHRVEKRLVEKIKNDPKNPISVLLKVGTGMKTKQLVEFLIMVGLRPSLDGQVITHPINNGFFIKGLDRPSYMYIDALGARKPLLANNKEMGPVGYFCKTLNLAARTLEVSGKQWDCGTEHYVNYNIKTKEHLKRLRGKYYYDDETDDLVLIDTKDSSLIGKTLPFRSAVTCCCGENHVCPTCVGQSINYNWDIRKGFGVFITEEYSKDIEQNVLSTKHLLVTKSERIEFSDTFHRYFTLDGEEIKLLDGVKDAKDLMISIDPDDIQKVEEMDDDSTYNNYIDSGKFNIVNTKTGEIAEVRVENNKKIYIRTEMSEVMDANNGMIPLSELDEETPIFEISIQNSELTKPFYDLIALLDSENRKDMDDVTIDSISNRFLDILVEAGLNVPIAAGEITLNRLCRKPDNVRKRPNFGKAKLPPYKFYGVSKVVENNASPTVGLIFEQLQRQLIRLDMDERRSTSYIDPFFKELVSTEPLMKHRRQIEEEKKHGYDDEDI